MKHYFIMAPLISYMLKCVIGLAVCYLLYKQFPQHPFYWSMISVLLALAPDQNDGDRLAYERIKANILGSTFGLLIFLVHKPNLFMMCIGVIITIAVAAFLKLENATRSALAALMIVLLHEQEDNNWHIALERMLCVIVGCIAALLVTLAFTKIPGNNKVSPNLKQ